MMKITALTTDEQIAAPIHAAREALASHAMSGKYDSSSLADEVNVVAATEGRAQAQHTLRNALAFRAEEEAAYLSGESETAPTADVSSIKEALMALVLGGADDTWSGRSNDAKRAKFDGLRKEVNNTIRFPVLDQIVQASDEAARKARATQKASA